VGGDDEDTIAKKHCDAAGSDSGCDGTADGCERKGQFRKALEEAEKAAAQKQQQSQQQEQKKNP
jgi:hypothetical protein